MNNSAAPRYEYGFEDVGGHVVLVVGNTRALLDSGSPKTITDLPSWNFCGRTRHLESNIGGQVTVGSIDRYVGADLDVLLGCDLLAEMPWTVDWAAKTVTFDASPAEGGTLIELCPSTNPLMRNVPVVPIKVRDRALPLLWDLGATKSYLPASAFGGVIPSGTYTDFYPTAGNFETRIYELPLGIAGDTVMEEFGELPECLSAVTQLAAGLLGSGPLKTYRTRFDLEGGTVRLWRLDGREMNAGGAIG